MNLRTSSPPTVVRPGDRPRRNPTTVLLVVLVVLALMAGAVVVVNLTRDTGAGSATKVSGGPASPPPSDAAPPTAVDPQATTKAAILDAYRQSYDAFVAITNDPAGSPDDPRLAEHKIGNALLASQLSIIRLRKAGQVSTGNVQVHPSVVELTADTAVVADCGIDGLSVVDARTGEVVTPAGPPDVGSAATATYRRIDGVWMQNTFKDEKRSCVPAS